MKRKLIKYNSIIKYNYMKKYYTERVQYKGKDEKGESIYDSSILVSPIEFTFSEKLHGENASVAFSLEEGIYYQTRKSIINESSKYYGHFQKSYDFFDKTFQEIIQEHNIDMKDKVIVLYGEMIGEGVGKSKSAGKGLDLTFVIFQYFKIASIYKEGHEKYFESYYLESKTYGQNISYKENNILNIMDYYTFNLKVDFNNPKDEESLNQIVIQNIEPNSPFGKSLGQDGNVGEGIVGTAFYNGELLQMKIKGNKHAKNQKVPKIKTKEESDFENKCLAFAEYISHNWRLEQMLDEIKSEKGSLEKRYTRDFINKFVDDCKKEEYLELEQQDLSWDNVTSYLQKIASKYFLEAVDNQKITKETK